MESSVLPQLGSSCDASDVASDGRDVSDLASARRRSIRLGKRPGGSTGGWGRCVLLCCSPFIFLLVSCSAL